jgi:hypothetical protein
VEQWWRCLELAEWIASVVAVPWNQGNGDAQASMVNLNP